MTAKTLTDMHMPTRANQNVGDLRAVTALAAGLRGAAAALPNNVEPEIRGLLQWVRPGDVCVDVGGEYGLYTLQFAAMVGPAGRVITCEAQPNLARYLATRMRWLGAANVTVVPVAVGETEEQSTISIPRRGPLAIHGRAFVTCGTDGLGSNAEFSGFTEVPVTVRPLNKILADSGVDRVRFIKVDVEGGEARVLAGAREVIERMRPLVMLEIEERHLSRFSVSPQDVVTRMRGYGYTMHVWSRGRWAPIEQVSQRKRNYLFVP